MADKKITELQLRDNVDGDVNVPVDDGIQSYRTTAPQWSTYILPDAGLLVKKLGAETFAPNWKMNYSLVASVGSSALTIALKNAAGADPTSTSPVAASFRNATLTTGTCSKVVATAATSLVISSGSTLGSVSAKANWIYVYLINNAGTLELAASASKMFDEGSVYTTTAEGGAGAADSKDVLYSTTQRTSVAVRLIGRIKSTQSTAGTWATAPSEIALAPFEENAPRSEIILYNATGYGSTNTKIPKYATKLKDKGGDDMTVTTYDDATLGAAITILKDGIYTCVATHNSSGTTEATIGITKNSAQLTTTVYNIVPPERLAHTFLGSPNAQQAPGCTFTGFLAAGDVIRSHGNGSTISDGTYCTFSICKVAH